MSTISSGRQRRVPHHAAFCCVAVWFMLVAFTVATLLPVAASVTIVFLFAGPHNYVETRYFLTRLPARMGRLLPFFVASAAGIAGLSLMLPVTVYAPQIFGWSSESVFWGIGIWNTGLILWCTTLADLRSRQPPRRKWDYAWPIGLAAIGVSWLQPFLIPLALVFAHPLMGVWILDAELRKTRPQWQGAVRSCMLLIPILVGAIWIVPIADSELISVSPSLRAAIEKHAGGHLLMALDSRRLISTHAFLELVHYGVWIAAMPAVSGRVFQDGFRSIPLLRKSQSSRRVISLFLIGLSSAVLVLWFAFTVDYQTTRTVYFTVATVHVLAEVPFLLRLL